MDNRNTNRGPLRSIEQPHETTLRLARAEIDLLRAEMDAVGAGAGQADREFKRWPFDRVPVRMKVTHPGGPATTLWYACRNLSRGGIGLLHAAFVHTGSRCVVFLPTSSGGEVPTSGTVVRVRHVKGRVHEIGVRFDKPIDIRRILGLKSSEGQLVLEKVTPATLTGTLLHVEDSEIDRRLIRHFLEETNLDVVVATSGSEALERLLELPDVILSDMELGDMTGLELLSKLRASGIPSPFILSSADPSAPMQSTDGSAAPDGFLAKPITQQRLLGALGEVLLLERSSAGSQDPSRSELSPQDPLAKEIPAFIAELVRITDTLERAIAANDSETARRVAFQIRGSAPAFGFNDLGRIATDVYNALARATSALEASTELRHLKSACMRVLSRDAA